MLFMVDTTPTAGIGSLKPTSTMMSVDSHATNMIQPGAVTDSKRTSVTPHNSMVNPVVQAVTAELMKGPSARPRAPAVTKWDEAMVRC